MKRLLYLICFSLIVAGCGSAKRPSWLIFGNDHLDSYRNYYLTDSKKTGADLRFKSALDEFKKSGDLDLMQKAWLTRIAMQVALLEEPETDNYRNLADIHPVPANNNYYLFLTGDIYRVNTSLLPSQYRDFLNRLKNGNIPDIEKSIGSMKNEPVSLLIAAGIANRQNIESEMIISAVIDTASKKGWKSALLTWMERKAVYYESAGKTSKASKVRRHMELIE
jgi:hypothetical protein